MPIQLIRRKSPDQDHVLARPGSETFRAGAVPTVRRPPETSSTPVPANDQFVQKDQGRMPLLSRPQTQQISLSAAGVGCCTVAVLTGLWVFNVAASMCFLGATYAAHKVAKSS